MAMAGLAVAPTRLGKDLRVSYGSQNPEADIGIPAILASAKLDTSARPFNTAARPAYWSNRALI